MSKTSLTYKYLISKGLDKVCKTVEKLHSNSLVSSSNTSGGSRKRSMKSGLRGHDTRGSILGLRGGNREIDKKWTIT